MQSTHKKLFVNKNLGTYSFDEFDEKTKELARLKEQATAFWPLENEM